MTDYVLIVFLVLGLLAVLIFVARRPAFWLELFILVVKKSIPIVLKLVKLKDFTQEQLDRIAEGNDPFNISKYDHEKWVEFQRLKKEAKNGKS